MNGSRLSLAAILATLCLAGIHGSARGADTTDPVVTLRLGTAQYQGGPGDSAVMRHFADKVEELSGGSIDIQLVYEAAAGVTDYEAKIVSLVQSGDLEIGWVASRAFDALGIHSFQALQSPFLITDYSLFRKVMASPMPGLMLAGLDRLDLVGLGLYPDKLRHPAGVDRPLVSLADFQGITVRVPTSDATDALWRAFGSDPVHLNGIDLGRAQAIDALDGAETTMDSPMAFGARYVTGNVTLYPTAEVLFLSLAATTALTDRQVAALRAAATETQGFALADLPLVDSGQRYCHSGGSVVIADQADVEAIIASAAPVTAVLESDPQTRGFIDRIRALRANTPAPPAATSTCEGIAAPTAKPGADASGFPAGTYATVATRQDALRSGIADECATRYGGASLRLVVGDGRYFLFRSCDSVAESEIDDGTFTSDPATIDMHPTWSPGQWTAFLWTIDGEALTLAIVDETNAPPGDIPFNHFLYEHRWLKQDR